jgi:hypothetical protein
MAWATPPSLGSAFEREIKKCKSLVSVDLTKPIITGNPWKGLGTSVIWMGPQRPQLLAIIHQWQRAMGTMGTVRTENTWGSHWSHQGIHLLEVLTTHLSPKWCKVREEQSIDPHAPEKSPHGHKCGLILERNILHVSFLWEREEILSKENK